MGTWKRVRFWSERRRAVCLGVFLAAMTVPLVADLAWAQEPPQRDERKRITFKMRMEAAERRKLMIEAISAKQKAEQQQGGSVNQQAPAGAPLAPSTNPGQ